MGSGKRQAFSRGGFFRAFFEGVWDAFLGGNGYDVSWGVVREATLSECITAPLARMSLERNDLMYAPALVLAVRRTVCAQLEALWGGKDPTALPATMPVTGEEPVPFLTGMALAGPAHKQVQHQVVASAQRCCCDDFQVVGCTSANDRIELLNILIYVVINVRALQRAKFINRRLLQRE